MRVDLVSSQVGRTSDGVELRLRSPWYRSLPLSCVDVEVTIDAQAVDPGRMTFHVNDHDHPLATLPELVDEDWFVLDAGRVRVAGVAPGEHDVEVRLALRIPYLFDEETGDVLVVRAAATKKLSVPEVASVT